MPLTRASTVKNDVLVPQSRIDSATPGHISNFYLPGTPTNLLSTTEIETSLIYIPKTVTINGVALRAGDTGFGIAQDPFLSHLATVRFGIYSIADGLPARLLYNTDFSVDKSKSANSFLEQSVSSFLLPEGFYWSALLSLDSTFNLAGVVGPSSENRDSLESLMLMKFIGATSSGTTAMTGLTVAPTTGAPGILPPDVSLRSLSFLTSAPTQSLLRLRVNTPFLRLKYV